MVSRHIQKQTLGSACSSLIPELLESRIMLAADVSVTLLPDDIAIPNDPAGDPVDFGTVGIGAPSDAFTFNVVNNDALPIQLLSIDLPATGFEYPPGGQWPDFNELLFPDDPNTFSLRLDTSAVGQYEGVVALNFDTDDDAAADFTYRYVVSGAVIAPDIAVAIDGTDITSGDTPGTLADLNLGTVLQNDPALTQEFVITNASALDLNVNDITVDAPFEIQGGFAGPVVVDDEGNLPFTVSLPTDAFGTFNGQVSIASNDPDEAPFVFTVEAFVNAAPTADAGPDQAADEGATVNFAGAVADDNGIIDIDSYFWDFGDGSPTVANQFNPSHTYADNGVYTVTLTVTDDHGAVGTDTMTVTVNNVAPTVDAGADQAGDEGDSFNFAGAVNDPGADALTYAWNFGDGGTSDQANPSHTFTDEGTYTVTLTVTDDDGGSNSDTLTVTIANVDPTVDIGGNLQADEGQDINFQANVVDPGSDNITYSWNFGDGSSSGGANPTHAYGDEGTYTVTVTVNDGDGGTATDTLEVVVDNVAPSVDLGANRNVVEGDIINFNATVNDPGDDALTYAWDFGDGETSTATQPTHTYPDDGVFTVSLTVTDEDGASGSDTIQVTVANGIPIVNAGPDRTIDEGSGVAFNPTVSDPGVNDTHTYFWNFGDGTTSNQLSPTHIYAQDGTYNVSLTVSDDDGGQTIDTLQIVVTNLNPTIQTASSKTGLEGSAIDFTATANDAGTQDTLTAVWDFGDGNTFNGLNASHTYAGDGTYTATLTVSDGDGGVATEQVAVTVNQAAPIVTVAPVGSADAGQMVSFAGSFTDPGDTGQTIEWDFGDGSSASGDLNPTHTYAQSGVYTATLTVSNNDGEMGQETVEVTVYRTMAFSRGDVAEYYDGDNDLVKVVLNGPGSGLIRFVGQGNADAAVISMTDTTDKSSVIVKTIGKGSSTAVGMLEVNSGLKQFTGTTTTLVDGAQVNGSLSMLKVQAIAGNAAINTTEAANGFVMQAETVGDAVSFDIADGVKKFQVDTYAGGSVTAHEFNNVIIRDGGLNANLTATQGGINRIVALGDIAAQIESAQTIKNIISKTGGMTAQAAITTLDGDIMRAKFSTDVAGTINAADVLKTVLSPNATLSGVLRGGDEIGTVKFNDIDGATVSSYGDVIKVQAKQDIVDSYLFAGFDLGADALPGTADDALNQSGAELKNVKTNLRQGVFDLSWALAGVQPYEYNDATGDWTVLAPQGSNQVMANNGSIGTAVLGQVFANGDSANGQFGLFAVNDIGKVRKTDILGQSAPAYVQIPAG